MGYESPGGHPLEKPAGRAGQIEERGTLIVRLGAAMQDATTLLHNLVENGAEMEGKSVDKLKEAAKEVYKELGKAADFYDAVGPYIRDYGTTLGTVKGLMETSVPEAITAWKNYQNALSAWTQAQNAPVTVPAGAGDDDTAQQDAENAHDTAVSDAAGDKETAYNQWISAGETFDGQWSQWDTAYKDAIKGIKKENDKGVEDDFWDDLDGFVDVALDILAIAGVVLAVLALVVGGPIVALIALGVGVLALAGTLYQYGRGDAELWEVGLAVLGVIPFGAFGEFASGGFKAGMRAWTGLSRGGLSLGDDAARWSLSLRSSSVGNWVNNMRTLGPEAGFLTRGNVLTTLMSGQDGGMWDVIGQLGTTGQQAVYAFSGVGAHYNNINTLVGGIQGIVGLVTD